MPPLTSSAAWPLEPSLVVALVLAALYAAGGRGAARSREREAAFYGGLVLLVAAAGTPLGALGRTSFAAHMTSHLLLLTAVPPLLLLGDPWPRVWRPLPAGLRGRTARAAAPLAPLGRALARPLPAWILANAVLVAWHVPVLFDAALHNGSVHALEHLLFVGTALVFWAQVIDAAPVHAPLDDLGRVAYLTGAMVVGWLLAIVLVFEPSPLYAYADLAHRAGGLSAVADQQLAGGIMWVPGSIAYTVAAVVCLYRWLEPQGAPAGA